MSALPPVPYPSPVPDPSPAATPARLLADLAATIAELGGAPSPRAVPELIARLAAPVGDLITKFTGRDFPMTTARLRALHEQSIFPSDKLAAAGFQHPQTTREGLAEMLASKKVTATKFG